MRLKGAYGLANKVSNVSLHTCPSAFFFAELNLITLKAPGGGRVVRWSWVNVLQF